MTETRQSPNVHASMPIWLVARGNKQGKLLPAAPPARGLKRHIPPHMPVHKILRTGKRHITCRPGPESFLSAAAVPDTRLYSLCSLIVSRIRTAGAANAEAACWTTASRFHSQRNHILQIPEKLILIIRPHNLGGPSQLLL